MQDLKEALKDVTMSDKKDKLFIEVLNLRAYVNRLIRTIIEHGCIHPYKK